MDELTPLLGAGLNVTIGAPLAAIAAEVDPETCQLLGPVALAVQGLMGLIVMGSLVLKRAQEEPKRKWKVWLGDVGKQVVGQAFVHASNVLISDLIARHALDNPCSLYALNILIDTTLGVLVLFGFLKLSTRLMLRVDPSYKTGDYGNPFDKGVWARQAAVYVACLFAMKVVVLLLFWAFPALFKFANWCLSWLPSDDAQVVFVMLVFPLVMNLFQFLTIDSILRSKSPLSSAFLSPTPDDEARGFLEPSSDDLSDDEDEEGGKKRRTGAGRGEMDSGYEGATGSPPYSRGMAAGTAEGGGDVGGGRLGGGGGGGAESGPGSGTSTPRASAQGHHAYPPTSSALSATIATARAPPPTTARLASYGAASLSPPLSPSLPPTFTSLDEKGFSLSSPSEPFSPEATEPQEESDEEEEEEDDWGADWGASMTSLELQREVAGMMGDSSPSMTEKAALERERAEVEMRGKKLA